MSLMEHEEQQRRQNDSNNNDVSTPSVNDSPNTNGNHVSPTPSPSVSPRPSPSLPIDSPPLIPRSPSPSANDPSPRQNPSSSRFFLTSSPLGSHDNAVSSTQPSLAPPTGRTHRRSGSTPGTSSGGTLAAALSAAQTASAFLSTADGARQAPLPSLLPRSAPQTRAASPNLQESSGLRGEEGRTLQGEPQGGPPSLVVHPSEGPSQREVVASMLNSEASSSALATGSESDPLSVSPVPLTASATPPVSDLVDDASSQDHVGYQTLSSSSESSDPLLGWHK